MLIGENIMTQQDMFEAAFKRPKNFFKLSFERQWEIDKDLGILDWDGSDLTDEEKNRLQEHFASV